MEYVKQHPYIVIGGAVAIVALLALSRGGSNSVNPAAAAVQSQAVADSANVQLSQVTSSLEATNNQTQAGLALGLAQNDTNLASAMLSFFGNFSANQTAADMNRRQVNGAIQINSNTNATMAQVAPKIAQINASAAEAITSNTNAAAMAIATTNANAAVEQARIGATASNVNTGLNNAGGIMGGAGGFLGGLGGLFGGGGGAGGMLGGGGGGGLSLGSLAGIMSLFGGGAGAAGAAGAGAGAAGIMMDAAPLLMMA